MVNTFVGQACSYEHETGLRDPNSS